MFALGLATLSVGVLSVWSAVKGVKVTTVAGSILTGNTGDTSKPPRGTATEGPNFPRRGGRRSQPSAEQALGIPGAQ